MTRFVSIVGLSAVGKKSLIRRLLLPEAGHLRRRLGLAGTLAAFGPSFDPGGLPAILGSSADIALVQWQWATDHLVLDLLTARPGDRHEALVLWKPAEDHRLDVLLHRPPWRPSVAELDAQGRELRRRAATWRAAGVAVRRVDARTYRVVGGRSDDRITLSGPKV